MSKMTKQVLKDKGLNRSMFLKSLLCGLDIPRVEKNILLIMVEAQEKVMFSRNALKRDLMVAYSNIESYHNELCNFMDGTYELDGEAIRLAFLNIKIDC